MSTSIRYLKSSLSQKRVLNILLPIKVMKMLHHCLPCYQKLAGILKIFWRYYLFFENLLTRYCEISSEILKTMKIKIFHGDPVFVEKHYED